MQRSRIIAGLLVCGAFGGTAAATASADSIAYVKGGNVYLAPGDLSREFQVTSTGGYSAVSQADDGTLLATAGGDLRRLDRTGDVLSDIATPASGQGNSGLDSFYGPFDTDISPDGRTAAYGYVHSGWNTDGGSADLEQRNGTGYTNPAALTGFTDAGYHYQSDWDAPEFIDNQTVLLSNGPGYPSDPIAIETVGSNDPQGWFTDPDNPHPLDATISRDHRLIADVAGPDRQRLVVYRDQDGQLLGDTNTCFSYADSGSYKYESPTFNANGTRLYWSDGTKLQTAPIGDMSTGCAPGQNGTASFTGTSPDWGPADAPTGRPGGPTGPSGPTGPTGPTGRPGRGHVTARLALAGPATGSLTAVRRHGMTVHVTVPRAGRLSVVARLGHTTVATGHARARHGGTATVRLPLTAAGRRALRHRRRVTLTIIVVERRAHAAGRMRLSH